MEQKKIIAKGKKTITVDGLQFKDLDNTGILKPYEDWRLSAEERAQDLVSRMTDEEKAGMFVIGDLSMGISNKPGQASSHNGILSEEFSVMKSPLGERKRYPSTWQLATKHIRHFIVRENSTAQQMATWVNALQEVCEGTRLGIPCIVASNSRNEAADLLYSEQQDKNNWTTFPGTLGLAAARNAAGIHRFAEIGRDEFKAANIRKGYMYMADCATDPRWFRTFGTFGENPEQIAEIFSDLVPTYQGERLNEDGIALTVKHFPGGGARENGFDPHYVEGKFNVYATPGSLEKYHLPPFKAACKKHPSAIMPYYAIPSNEKSAVQAPFNAPFAEEIAFAYNKQFITDLLRGECGFDGYVNSDSGVLGRMAWGAEELSQPQRAAKALLAGTDMVSGEVEAEPFLTAIKEKLVPMEVVDRSLVRLFKELFALGLFENPYVDEEAAAKLVRSEENLAAAAKAHRDGVVVLKNKNGTLPLTDEKLAGKKIYVELLCKTDYSEEDLRKMALSGSGKDPKKTVADFAAALQKAHPTLTFVEDYTQADLALLFLNPTSGSYFEATPTYLDLEIHKETGIDMDRVRAIRAAVPQVVMHVNLNLAFLLCGVEELCDGLSVGFNSFAAAAMDVLTGKAPAVGKLPLTLPGSHAAIAVDENGKCASPNDVPGFDKAAYMDIPYAYRDEDGNEYCYGFGLTL